MKGSISPPTHPPFFPTSLPLVYVLMPFYLFFSMKLFTLFFFVLSSNVLGLVPYSFTLTSQLVVTFCLGFGSFFGLNWIGIRKHGLHLLSFFLPKGALHP